jgi:hypothetical protein
VVGAEAALDFGAFGCGEETGSGRFELALEVYAHLLGVKDGNLRCWVIVYAPICDHGDQYT